MKAFVSWSGGKESCLACYKATLKGLEVACLVNMVTIDGTHSMTHRMRSGILRAQAECIGIPIIQKKTTWDTYEKDFKEVVRELKAEGVETGVFGDIDIQEHREWVHCVCEESGIEALEPLWGMERTHVLSAFIEAGFKAVVVCSRADLFDKDVLNLPVDEFLAEYLVKRSIDVCGEGGEYHTLVLDGPLFRNSMEIVGYKRVFADGYWILHITDYRIEKKKDSVSAREKGLCTISPRRQKHGR
jgi:uncharacterized protein (TIGR00290 family)